MTIINTAFFSLYLIKPRKSDDKSYNSQSRDLQFFLKIGSKRNTLFSDNNIINYDSFDSNKGIFYGLSIINIKTNDIYSAQSGILVKTNNIYNLDIKIQRAKPLLIPVLNEPPKSLLIEKTFNLYLKIRNELVFYPKIIERAIHKKNVYFYINLFFIILGLNAVFMFFGLISSVPSKRIFNISNSFLLLPVCFLAIHYIYKIPIDKIVFLNKGFISRINAGLIMLVLTLILILIAIFKIKSNSRREA